MYITCSHALNSVAARTLQYLPARSASESTLMVLEYAHAAATHTLKLWRYAAGFILSLRSRVKGSLRSRLLNSLRSLFFSSLRSRCLSLWLGLTASPGLRALRSSQAPRYARHPSGPTGPPGYRRGPPDPAGRETLYYILIRARPVSFV